MKILILIILCVVPAGGFSQPNPEALKRLPKSSPLVKLTESESKLEKSINPMVWIQQNWQGHIREVTIIQKQSVPIYSGQEQVGQATLPADLSVPVQALTPDFVTIEFMHHSHQVPVSATDLEARAIQALADSLAMPEPETERSSAVAIPPSRPAIIEKAKEPKPIPLEGSFASVAYVNCDEFYQTSFKSRELEPYWECTFKRPAYIEVDTLDGRKAAKCWWSAKDYDGSRLDKGMEACSGNSTSELRFREDGWYGFNIYFPADDYPDDKNCIVLQLFAHGKGGSWAGTLIVNDNRLSIEHRDWLTKNHTVFELDGDIPRDTWLPIIIYWKPSTNPENGKVMVWYKNAPENSPTYEYTGKFAYDDEWDGDTMLNGIGLKWGMYCADSANYTKNETRTIYYDDVGQLKGNPVGAWELVNPLNEGRNAFARIDAEYYSDHFDTVTEACSDEKKGLNLTDLQDGDWTEYQDINLGDGVSYFQARVASATTGGTIEVRLGSKNGKVLGKCEVENTGGAQKWVDKKIAISSVSGLQTICLKFTGESEDLFNLNSFTFTK